MVEITVIAYNLIYKRTASFDTRRFNDAISNSVYCFDKVTTWMALLAGMTSSCWGNEMTYDCYFFIRTISGMIGPFHCKNNGYRNSHCYLDNGDNSVTLTCQKKNASNFLYKLERSKFKKKIGKHLFSILTFLHSE